MSDDLDLPLFRCDQCRCWFTAFEFAETIEEWLCEGCASGISDDDQEFDDGFEDETA